MSAIRLTGREGPLELIRAANTLDVFDVLYDFFGSRYPRSGRSGKEPCPFGFEHPDGGYEKAFRTYPEGNNGYCFAAHGYLDPVRLVQIKDDLSATIAARKLLEHYDLLKPMPYWERFAEVQRLVATRRTEVGNLSYAVEALHVALRTHPAYDTGQYAQPFTEALERCLSVLDKIAASRPDQAEALLSRWFEKSVALMRRTLDTLSLDVQPVTVVNND